MPEEKPKDTVLDSDTMREIKALLEGKLVTKGIQTFEQNPSKKKEELKNKAVVKKTGVIPA